MKSKLKILLVSILLSCLSFLGVERTQVEDDDVNIDDNEHMFI